MSAFAVVLDRDGIQNIEQVRARLKEQYGNVYEYVPSVLMVSADALTADIARAAGIKTDDAERIASGAVFRISGYSGFTDRALWEWFGRAEL